MSVGSRWLEVATNRVVVITDLDKPWFYYEDDPKRTPWWCCVEDFTVWGRFKELK